MNEGPIGNRPLQWEYGKLRESHSWVIWVTLASGIVAFPLAWILRDSLTLGRAPLPSWTVLLVGAIVALAGVTVSIALLRARSSPAKLITIRDGAVSVPGSLISGAGWSLPLSDVTVRTTELGFVKQLHLSGGRKRTTLSSALFADEKEFDRLVNELSSS